jgi:CheY-like chemotaxis protein
MSIALRGTVLLVEDDATLRNLLARLLRRMRCHVWEAEDGPAALALYHELGAHPDLVITDTLLPGFDGFEVIRRIRDVEPGQLFLRISGLSEAHLPAPPHARDVPFLQKPFGLDSLLDTVREMLLPQARAALHP